MGLARSALLWASDNEWLRRAAPRLPFVRAAVRRFMPGETLDAALDAARSFQERGIPTTFTHLGENVVARGEAEAVTEHYLGALERIAELGLDTEISVKLTHLGLDLDPDLARRNFERCVGASSEQDKWVWIDMESSAYVDRTLEVYRRALGSSPRVGICLQAYLYRTLRDLEELLPLEPSIRLVKGAYREPSETALQGSRAVDANFIALTERILDGVRRGSIRRYAAATHDVDLLARTAEMARASGMPKSAYEIQMLYGIRQADQYRLREQGYPVRTLISYGPAWYPWYVRRLAEHPSNVWFVARNVFTRPPDRVAATTD